ncbi:MAG: ABC transporter ATP-binding protein, partial [Actinomycetota bacterium]|nr:ABC transporter ATP-binding protein [Actinomycetota bacterium]
PGPRVLVADEPTAHLDRVTGRLVIRLLQQAAHEYGTTVIAATHDPDFISAADTRLMVGSHEEQGGYGRLEGVRASERVGDDLGPA